MSNQRTSASAGASGKVSGESRTRLLRDRIDHVLILGMIDADREPRSSAQVSNHRGIQLEAQKVHRRGFLLVLPFEIFVGNRQHPRGPLT